MMKRVHFKNQMIIGIVCVLIGAVVLPAVSSVHISYKTDTQQILADEDWSACGDSFQLCVAVLQKDYDRAIGLMRNIGEAGSVSEVDYIDWPVFRDFRATDQFVEAFTAIFGKEPVNISNIVKQPELDEVFGGEEIELLDQIRDKAKEKSGEEFGSDSI